MEAKVIKEEALYTLTSSDYNGEGPVIPIFASDLKESEVGKEWGSYGSGGCGRALDAESLKVVYKDNLGVLCIYREWGSKDSPDAPKWECEPELIWFELH